MTVTGCKSAFRAGVWNLLALAALFIWMAPAAHAEMLNDDDYSMMPVSDQIVAVTLTQTGDTEQDLMGKAAHKAVLATVGRIYFEDSILIATDILRSYVENQYQKFVVSTKVLSSEYVEGRPRNEVKVFVDIKKLREDLNEKRFIVRPRLEPYFDIYLSETIEGAEAPSPVGHIAAADILRDEPNVRVNDTGANNTPTNLDIQRSPTIRRSALINAQKNNVEAIITGVCETRLDRSEDLYFTTYYFYNTVVELALIRVDTGEVLYTAKSEKLASDTNTLGASNLSVQLAVTDAMSQLLEEYRKNWQIMIGHEADYVFMFTGVGPQQLATLMDTLNGFGPGAQAYLKNYWERIAVVSLKYDGPQSRVTQFTDANPYPVLRLIQTMDNHMELSVD